MTLITEQAALDALCARLSQEPFITIDTEFLRDKTYYPRLCLVQVAAPEGAAFAIDPLAKGLDLAPLLKLMANHGVVKVFHAARQDLEIFYNLMGEVPAPLFDTQVAAMVCGFGDQAGYHTLVAQICKARLDKGAQFTDWSRRPLSDKQMSYALDDVTYLRDVYHYLSNMLDARGRNNWAEQEMAILENPRTYENPPEDAWKRIKIKTDKPHVLAILKEIAAWREREAQRRDIPRNRIVRDEVLADIAIHPPKDQAELKRIRNLPGDLAHGKPGHLLLEAVARGVNTPKDKAPDAVYRERFPSDLQPTLEMLKMLLKIISSEQGVAARLIASSDDLEALARDDQADILALKGWRFDIFGQEALDLKHGKLALSLKDGQIVKKSV